MGHQILNCKKNYHPKNYRWRFKIEGISNVLVGEQIFCDVISSCYDFSQFVQDKNAILQKKMWFSKFAETEKTKINGRIPFIFLWDRFWAISIVFIPSHALYPWVFQSHSRGSLKYDQKDLFQKFVMELANLKLTFKVVVRVSYSPKL